MKSTRNNILAVDYYKATHWLLYPKKLEFMTSYGESRGGIFPESVFFNMQPFVNQISGRFVEQWMIDEAEMLFAAGFGTDKYFNKEGWQYIVDEYDGYLPLEIRAVKEGSVIPTKHVLFTITNTDPKCAWLTNYMETSLLRAIWYGTTVASLSYAIKKEIKAACDASGCEMSPFHLNDFGARGVSSQESAEVGGGGHLVNFLGTDTVEAVAYLMREYGAEVCGFSVMASEHSTTTIYGRHGETEAFGRFLDECPDANIVSIVIDSYNDKEAVQKILGGTYKDRILAREGKVVFRPDSGDPTTKPIEVVQWLWDIFGGTVNEAGYKELNPKVGVLQGDGIGLDSIKVILKNLLDAGFAASCLIFGCGGGLLQQVDRDTMKWAVKCCHAVIDGQDVDVFKDPITDQGKTSKKGQLALTCYNGEYKSWEQGTFTGPEEDNLLEVVFRNGVVLRTQTLDEVRALANQAF